MAKKQSRIIGLARVLSKRGYCSRSHAAELIRAGRVTLTGKIKRDPEAPTSEDHPQIAVDGILIRAMEKVYLMLNKPRGVVTTSSDEKGRDTVYNTLNDRPSYRAMNSWLAPVGRLDKASEGLLFLTNDSEWGARIAAPETHLPKTYHVQISVVPEAWLLQALTLGIKDRGVAEKDGELLRAQSARLLRTGQKNCWIEVILDEGRNRHIRRMMDSLQVEVLRLIRVAIGPLQLGNLAKGDHRPLTSKEKQMLDQALSRRNSKREA